ncbi:DUF4349 domain-containing protein [Hymenobacter sp. J193]|uniref:DUF4349 domain-containing protein n=1 Tax=Hymenobacter sp. J193 TaxID=2898429 RepID=UPI002151D4C8|nr:DUF4349 domain-containing protein [Hymenobacter sp. J193]MCR5886493.1 DUF4349 domain-containing protein [Hymenobacter sp. J193]
MKKYLRLLPLAGLMLVGCAQQQAPETVEESPAQEIVVPAATELSGIPLGRLWQTRRPVIYEGEMRMAVQDFAAATSRLDTVLYQHHAYLAEAHEAREDSRHTQRLTIRVPSTQFLALTVALGRLGYVESKDIRSRDLATEQLRVRTIPRAATDTTTLSAHDRLLAEEATLGTLHLQYYQPVPTEMEPQAPLFPRLAAGLRYGWYLLGESLIVVTYFWPLTLLVGAWLLYRWRRALISR